MDLFRSPKFRQTVFTVSRLLLGAVFIYASLDKIIDPAAFARAIDNYQIVSPATGRLVSWILPWIELVCGTCLIINRRPRGSALITAGLMVVFMAALGYNMARGMDVHCGCFTLDEKAPGNMWYDLARDAVLLIMAVGITLHPRIARRPSAAIPR